MNTRDSEAVLGLFLERGCSVAATAEDADVVLVNTCSVREHAESRALSFVGTFKKLKIRPIVGLIGCMAINKGAEIFKKMRHIDLICGPGSLDKIPDYIDKIVLEKVRIINIEDIERNEHLYNAEFRDESDHAQVVISTGCSNFCSYCVVPYVRGKIRLRNPEDILKEVKRNISLGIKKITLLGQNVNDYKYRLQTSDLRHQTEDIIQETLDLRLQTREIDDRPQTEKSRCQKSEVRDHRPDSALKTEEDIGEIKRGETVSFVDLLRMVEQVEGLEKINFITSQPKNTSKELFTLMAKSSKISKNLHLPFQSGSNRILKLMKRGYSREKYLDLVFDFKKIVGGELSTDVIIGFPTETEQDFEQTKEIIEQVKFRRSYIFKYSSRDKAKSSNMKDDVSFKDKSRRHKILLDLQKKISKDIDADKIKLK